MKVIESVTELRKICDGSTRPLGLVPTMGSLHEGHMALVRRARADNRAVAASIFVNPTQFGPSGDFSTYPRDIQADLAKLEREGVDLVFAPSVEEIYPQGFDTHIDVGRIAARLEGASRPDHFKGVATVVCKLLALVRPDRAYFGQKDAQQCLVVKHLAVDLNLGTDIVAVPTVREPDGLALSSRNINLEPEERRAAPVVYWSLCLAQSLWESGVRDAAEVRRQMCALIKQEPEVRVDYVSIADSETLEELDRIDRPALVSLAVYIGSTRLIDNIVLR